MATDREYLKRQQAGMLNTSGTTSDAVTVRSAVNAAHSRTHHIQKTGTENAATNVAETVGLVIARQAQLASAKYLTGTNVANDSSNYVVITLSKRTSAGASQTTVASYNTHTSAQNQITLNVPAAFSLVTNTDSVIAAGSILTYTVNKYGSGQAVAVGVLAVDLEET